MFSFCFIKTHSAYMLFYKRMEPEEENGREYKFDVSSELLEVKINLVFSNSLNCVRCSCNRYFNMKTSSATLISEIPVRSYIYKKAKAILTYD